MMNTVLNSTDELQAESRRALLAERLRQASQAAAVPLSFAQQRLWFLDQLEPNSALYNVPTVVRMKGALDAGALQRALDGLVARHEILRTHFRCLDGEPEQVVDDQVAVELMRIDLPPGSREERERDARATVRDEANRPFDLANGPLVRAHLLRLEADEHWFLLTFHHIISDEWSLKICFQELAELYTAAREGRAAALPELPIQYADYALWQREWLCGDVLEEQWNYWNEHLRGNPPVLELPIARSRPASPAFRGRTRTHRLSPELAAATRSLAGRQDATLFMTLLAVFKALLHRYTEQDDVLVASPVAGRARMETESLIGFFVNTLILRTDVSGDPAFAELLRRVRDVALGAFAHGELPFEKLVEKLQPERSLNHLPFTHVMFSLQQQRLDEVHWPGLAVEFLDVESETAKFDLTFVAQEDAGGLLLRAEYNRDLFDDDAIARLLRHFETLLQGIVAAPDRRLSELPLLTEAEREQLLGRWNDTRAEYPRDKCVHELFEAWAARDPNAVAAVFDNESITYRGLNARANQLARLLKKFSVGPEVPVGLCTERSVETIVAMLAILKAGGAYVPLDPSYPRERLAFMLEDTAAPVLLTQQRLLSRVSSRTTAARVVCLDSDWELVARESTENLSNEATPENLAYVIYTSGSTGQPKGVAVPHRAINRLVLNTSYIRFDRDDRVAQVSNASFDAATFEIWGALLNGARLIGIGRDVMLSPKDFARELREKQVSAMFLTCSVFNQIAAEEPEAFATMGTVMFGGEAADPKSVRAVLQRRPPQRLVNGYGPTENTTFSACHEVRELPDDAVTVPIGRPIANSTCYVLDPHLNPLPIGVPGELFVGGDGLARGYWNRPELTAEKFVANPFGNNRLYRTGDLVRWLPNGTLEFLGRKDQQVKLRGFRVELGEIEAVLTRHPAVRDCALAARGESDRKQLIAYFVAAGRRAPTAGELSRFLRDKLPDYMVPSAFVQLGELPLTPNGKVDRRALPEPGQGRPRLEKRYATPRDEVELKLTEIWERVLGIHPIGIEDKFFELGGHSLLAVRLIAQIEKVFDRKLRLATIFQAQTIEQLAAIIREEIREGSALAGTSLVEIHSEGTLAPLFLVHGAGGGMFWGYVNLARHLGADRPVYGLKSRGLDGREELGSIEEMAQQYVEDLRAVQPHGPYHLGGYCFGGNVAFEMARQLRARGEEVALLALLNCVPANSSYGRIPWTPAWAWRFAKNLFYWTGYFRSWSISQRREFFRWKKETWLRRLGRQFHREPAPLAGVDAGNLVDLSSYSAEQRKLWETHIRALAAYRPKPYQGRVHLFRSPGHPLWCSFAADYGWSELAEEGVQIGIVPGVHEKVLEEPCVQVVADEIRKILDETEKVESNEVRAASGVGQTFVSAGSGDFPVARTNGKLESFPNQQAGKPAPQDLAFWKRQLDGAPALLDLPADRPRPAQLSGAVASAPVLFSREFTEALEQLSHAEKCPLFVTLLAGFQTLLARYTGGADIVTGAIRRGDRMIVRGDFSGSPKFRELLQQLRAKWEALRKRASSSWENFSELIQTADSSHAPLFQVLFAFDEGAEGTPVAEKLTGLRDAPLDLVLRLRRTPDGLTGRLQFSPELFDTARIARMIDHFGTLLEGALANPAERISILPLLPDHEARQVLIEWNATDKPVPGEATLVRWFEAQVERTPDAIALIDGHERFTYRELNARANQLAHHLRSLGVDPEILIGICLARSWRLVVALLATLKAGGAYVPLDPAYPADRLGFILEDTHAPVLLTEKTVNRIQPPPGTRVVCVDAEWNEIATNSRENPFSGVESANLAYVIYTSGSTGRPKGVALEHRNAVALLAWSADVFRADEIAGVLASTSICFDLSVFELFVPLTRGGTVIVAENALALPSLPARNEVTLINTVPSAIRELVRLKGVPPSVRVVNLAGEPLATSLVDAIYAGTSAQKVFDLYGPSETTTYSTFTLRRPKEPATIGRALANERVYLLDRNQQPVPIGLPGEIYIGGAGVGRGYLGRPELTAEKFVNAATISSLQTYFALQTLAPASGRLYRTGDLARWRADGNLEFLGRMDQQVKVRGFRIELGEIESVLRQHAGVREAVVLAREDQPGDKRLAAYLTAKPDRRLSVDDLRAFARGKLPEYMVPSAFVLLEAMPLTPNGKVDRKALPAPQYDRSAAGELVAPRTPVEEQLAAIWREVLGVKQVGVEDNFFELGGHSLLAMRVISRAREVFAVELPLSALFDAPTIAALANEIGSNRWTTGGEAIPLQPVSRDGNLPASFIQEQLWFFDQIQPGGHAYNVPIAFRLKGSLNVDALQRALDEIVRRHEALRTVLKYRDGNLWQVITPPGPAPFWFMDLEAAADRENELQRAVNAAGQGSFDLAHGPLMRVTLFRLSETDHALVVVAHHAIIDGWSWAVFFEELGALYDAFASGAAAPALPELPVQYADFAAWRKQTMRGDALERELGYWKEKLQGAAPVVELPADRDEAQAALERAEHRTILFPKPVADALATLTSREGLSPFMVLMGALSVTLHKWTQQSDMVLGTVVAGRSRRELENAIGCYMNFLPIRLRIAAEETGRSLLAAVRKEVLEAQAHQACPFEKIVEHVNPERRPNRNPLYNVALLLQNFPERPFRSATLEASPFPVEMHAPLVDLRFEAFQREEGLTLTCEYNSGLFDAATIEELLASCRTVLEALVQRPEAKLSETAISDALASQARRSRERHEERTIAIAATFTAEPLEEPVRYWMNQLEIPARIRFAPFNQVFQQLLDPASSLAANARGWNVLLVRWEDWQEVSERQSPDRRVDSADSNRSDLEFGAPGDDLEQKAHDFIAALKSAANGTSTPFLVLFCPPSAAVATDAERRRVFERLETDAAAELDKVAGVHVVTSCELRELYPVDDYYDAGGDELGRVPYTPVFFTALGTMIARRVHALSRPAPKVIVLDCDQTLWGGVCGEDGPKGICVDEPRRALQEFMRAQLDAGRLLAVCSKNNEADVRAVFEQRSDLPLRAEDFSAWRSNWQAKSENIRSIAAELNLGLDSFVFIDDNPVECAEMEARCPEVLTLQLPDDPVQIPQFLRHCWVFDQLKLTEEDRRRGELYEHNRQREELREQAGGLAEFIAGLNLNIQIASATDDEWPRLAQLTQRTNQFNCTTIRRTEAELRLLTDATILAVRVSDRFGDYGLVGAVVCEVRKESLDVETFLLSCRVLGRGVEHAVLAHLGRLAMEQGMRWVDVHYHRSEKNQPAFDFLKGVGAQYQQPLNGGFIFRFPAEVAAKMKFEPREDAAADVRRRNARTNDSESASSRRQLPPNDARKFSRCRAIALDANNAAQIHRAIEAAATRRTSASGYIEPRSELEQQLAKIWERLLRVERVGAEDNFFELGGHSLLAVRLFAELEKLTGRKFPLVTVFQAPTVAQLARALGRDAASPRSPLVLIRAEGSRPPLFLVHGAGGDVLWGYANLARHLSADQPIYGIKSRGQVGLDEYERIEDMARYYVEEVRRLQPNGPYYLGGYCFGGNVAYEMARQLRAQGCEVALVALLDASPANAGYERMPWWKPSYHIRFARNLSHWLADFAGLDAKDRRRYFGRKARVIGRKLTGWFRPKPKQREVDIESVIDPGHFPEHELKFWRIHLNAIERHVEQPYDGGVTLIRTRGQPLWCSLEEDFCWNTLARGGVAVRRIPGSHENIFVEPNVRQLAKEMERALAEARAATAPTIQTSDTLSP